MNRPAGTTRTDRQLREYRALPLFAGCSSPQLRRVAHVATRLDIAAGTVLVQQGKRPGQFVVVLDGTAEVRRDGQAVDEIGAGGFFGEIALVRRLFEPADVVARTALAVHVIAPREFTALYAEVDAVRRCIDDMLDQHLARWIRPSVARAHDAAPIPFASVVAGEPTSGRSRHQRARRAGGVPRRRVCRCRGRLQRLVP